MLSSSKDDLVGFFSFSLSVGASNSLYHSKCNEPRLQRRQRTNRLARADVASQFVQSQILGTC
jgi:hypothetical protein